MILDLFKVVPELPEVETITRSLRRKLIGWRIVDLWTDWPKYFELSGGFSKVKTILIGRKIVDLERRGKNILFFLSGDYILAVHLKMTGHFLFSPPLRPHYAHLIFDLKKGARKNKLYFSDIRKFARILVGRKDVVMARPEISKLGPDPLDLSLREFIARIEKYRGKIKTALLNQEILAGVGNIYSDEALYLASVHPLSRVEKIPQAVLRKLFEKLVGVLKKSLSLRGATRRDYRDVSG